MVVDLPGPIRIARGRIWTWQGSLVSDVCKMWRRLPAANRNAWCCSNRWFEDLLNFLVHTHGDRARYFPVFSRILLLAYFSRGCAMAASWLFIYIISMMFCRSATLDHWVRVVKWKLIVFISCAWSFSCRTAHFCCTKSSSSRTSIKFTPYRTIFSIAVSLLVSARLWHNHSVSVRCSPLRVAAGIHFVR